MIGVSDEPLVVYFAIPPQEIKQQRQFCMDLKVSCYTINQIPTCTVIPSLSSVTAVDSRSKPVHRAKK